MAPHPPRRPGLGIQSAALVGDRPDLFAAAIAGAARSGLGRPVAEALDVARSDRARHDGYRLSQAAEPELKPCGAQNARRKTPSRRRDRAPRWRSEEHTSELQSHLNLVCRLLLEKKKKKKRKEIRASHASICHCVLLRLLPR